MTLKIQLGEIPKDGNYVKVGIFGIKVNMEE